MATAILLFMCFKEVYGSLSTMKKERPFLFSTAMTSLSIWRSVRSTPVGLAGLRDPAASEANEEARFPPHGKRAISFGKYGFSLSRQLEKRRMATAILLFLFSS
ncbi:hypothetical protein BBI11_04720 [Planococcus maritimus]|nr:hypothetical protein BBI11_04720 [Planococcus maritimus]